MPGLDNNWITFYTEGMDTINGWTSKLHELYNLAIEKYQAGERGADTYFDAADTEFLSSIGLQPINVYDYAEDFVNHGEPDWETFLLVMAARRDFFLYETHENPNSEKIDSSELPPKDAEMEGIVWFPRILKKARCFLNGGLCYDIMYGCGGDRRFFRTNGLHPADFLRAVWGARGDDEKILEFVKLSKSKL